MIAAERRYIAAASVAGMVLTDIVARSRPDRIAPVDDMLEKAMTSRTARIGIIAAWWWFGWHLYLWSG